MSKPVGEKNVVVPIDVLAKLLTTSEMRMIQNRWEILNLLLDGLSIRKVAEEAHVGTDTVMRTSKMLENEDLRNTLVLIRTGGTKETQRNQWMFGTSKNEEDD
jgi:uncharacterized protein YerC